MAIIGDALRQAFMPKHEYESLREEEKAWMKLQRPLLIFTLSFVALAIVISTIISLKIVFPSDLGRRPFCRDLRIQPLSINITGGNGGGDSDRFPGAFYLTDQETVDYYWMVVFVPSALVFLVSAVYLVAGISVAYTAPTRHGCLKIVENNYCASRRGPWNRVLFPPPYSSSHAQTLASFVVPFHYSHPGSALYWNLHVMSYWLYA